MVPIYKTPVATQTETPTDFMLIAPTKKAAVEGPDPAPCSELPIRAYM